MPPSVKIKKEEIVNMAFKIIQKEGLEALNARKIANRLHCSVQPIFSNFENMDELKKVVFEKIAAYFYKFIVGLYDNDLPKYKQVGMNYIKFAQMEPNLYKILFLDNHEIELPTIEENNDDFKIIQQYMSYATKLNKNDMKKFHVQMWIFTHGLATLVASKNFNLDEKEIGDLLTNEFQALMLLNEKNNIGR